MARKHELGGSQHNPGNIDDPHLSIKNSKRLHEDLVVSDESPEFKPDPEEVAPLSEAGKAEGGITLENTQQMAAEMAARDKEKEDELRAKLNEEPAAKNPPRPRKTTQRASGAESVPVPPPIDDTERAAAGLPPLEAPGMVHTTPIPPKMPAEAAPAAAAATKAKAAAAEAASAAKKKADDNFELAVPMPDSARNPRRASRARTPGTPTPIPPEAAPVPPPLPPESAPAAPVPPPMPPAPRATRRSGPPPLDAAERARIGLAPLEAPTAPMRRIPTPPPMPREAVVPPPLDAAERARVGLPPLERPAGTPPPIPRPTINVEGVLARAPKQSKTVGALKSVGLFLTSPFRKLADAWSFKNQRMELGESMAKQSKSVEKNLVRVEAAKANHSQADKAVKDLERQLGVLDGQAAPASAKEAAARQKERNKLEAQLTDARHSLGERLLIVNQAEARTINHENKRAEIARQYAEVVDNRIAPVVAEREALNVDKQRHENEIATWRGTCDGYRNDIQRLELLAQENPAVRSTFRMQIKEAKRILADSERQLAQRVVGLQKIDGRLTNVDGIIGTWDLKKKRFQDIADKRMFRSHLDANTPSDTQSVAGFRDPVNRLPGNPINAREAAIDAAATGFEARENASSTFNMNEWIQNWNDMHGTRLNLSLDAMVDDGVSASYRNNPPEMNADQFAEMIRVYMRKHKTRTGEALDTKVKANQVDTMTRAALKRMQEAAVA